MKRIACTLVWIFAALTTCTVKAQTHAQVIVIANSGVRASTASKAEIREVFTGSASSLKGGVRVTPVFLKSSSVTDEFLAQYLDETDASFRIQWRTLIFSGQATMPRSLDTETAVVDYITHNPGAIGYISRSTPHESVRVLATR